MDECIGLAYERVVQVRIFGEHAFKNLQALHVEVDVVKFPCERGPRRRQIRALWQLPDPILKCAGGREYAASRDRSVALGVARITCEEREGQPHPAVLFYKIQKRA